MTVAERTIVRQVMLLNHSLDHLWTPLELVDLAHDLKQLHKVL